MVDLPRPIPVRGPTATPRSQPRPAAAGPAQNARHELATKSLPQLVRLAAELSSAPPPVDQARIAEIRDAISKGSYRIDPDGIARALLGDTE